MTGKPQQLTLPEFKAGYIGLRDRLSALAAADPADLTARAAVIEAEQALEQAGLALQAAERHLGDAFNRWQG